MPPTPESFLPALAASRTSAYEWRVADKNIVYFDLETQRSFGDVGNKKEQMGVSVAVTYSTARGSYEIYGESDMDRLVEELVRADLVVGWNHVQFDYPVLQGYTILDLASQTASLDMMLDLQEIIGHRLGLDAVAKATLGLGKLVDENGDKVDGLNALRWWKEYKQKGDREPLLKIAKYCCYDVKVTKCVHEYALEHGHLKYDDRAGGYKEVALNWA